MFKRVSIIVLIAAFLGAIAYFWPKGNLPVRKSAGIGTEPELHAGSRYPLDWDRELSGRPDRESLDSLRRKLLAMSAPEAVGQIEGFLASGKDRSTGLSFEIGADGAMEGWPTLRVFLLDLLLGIDPAEAARISRELLGSPTTADEWAISLRNVARGETDDGNRDFLKAKTEELISNPEWRAQPSVGYLNAFDVLVHTGATESSPLLSSLIQDKDRRDLAHAGFLTLDRLVQRDPVDMLARLQADRALQESRPEMTAQQFARADLRDARQRELVKAWLLDPARTPLELRNFAGTYPNNNRMISHNLLTSEERVSGAELGAHDREVLPLIRRWRADPAFGSLSPYLETMDTRLSQFVKSAEESSR